MPAQHRLELRSILLGRKMKAAADGLATQLGEGGRPPFTTARTRSEALEWWGVHRHDEYGQRVLERLPPWEIARLDADLAALRDPTQPGTHLDPAVEEALRGMD